MPIDMKGIIADTLLAMTKQKGIDKVTVKALIEECHISRQTFYYHFQDIMEVIEWSMERAVQETIKYTQKADTLKEALTYLIDSAVENHELIHKLMDSQKRAQMEKLLIRAIKIYLQAFIEAKARTLSISYGDVEIALDFYAFGISGLLLTYCQQKNLDTKGLAEQIYRLLPSNSHHD